MLSGILEQSRSVGEMPPLDTRLVGATLVVCAALFGWRMLRRPKPYFGDSDCVLFDPDAVYHPDMAILPGTDAGHMDDNSRGYQAETGQQGMDLGEMVGAAFFALLDEVYMFHPETFDIVFMNARARRRNSHQAQGQALHFGQIVPGLDRARLCGAVQQLLTGANDVECLDYEADEEEIHISLQLIQQGGGPTCFMAVLQRTEADESDAAQRTADYVATVSHELRTPLTSVKGAMELLTSGALGDVSGGAASVLSIAQRNIDRMISLTNEILDLAKLEAGQMKLNVLPMDMVGLVQDAIEVNAHYARQCGVALNADGLGPPVQVLGDRGRLMQVMSNLLSNAAKFSNPGQQVNVALTATSDRLRVSVIDQGQGVDAETRAQLFQRFGSSSLSAAGIAGSGLGLSIVKSIVQAHNGEIGVDSELGRGSEFYFDLPIFRDEWKTIGVSA